MSLKELEKIKELNAKIAELPMCEERDNLIKQREVLKMIEDAKQHPLEWLEKAIKKLPIYEVKGVVSKADYPVIIKTIEGKKVLDLLDAIQKLHALKNGEPCRIVIRYNSRYMPPASLFFLRGQIDKIAESFTPKLTVRTEEVLEGET